MSLNCSQHEHNFVCHLWDNECHINTLEQKGLNVSFYSINNMYCIKYGKFCAIHIAK